MRIYYIGKICAFLYRAKKWHKLLDLFEIYEYNKAQMCK